MSTEQKQLQHEKIVIVIGDDGTITHLQDDALNDLDLHLSEGKPKIKRASNVEPNEDLEWEVEFVNGEKIPKKFKKRGDAIKEETRIINERLSNGTWNSDYMKD